MGDGCRFLPLIFPGVAAKAPEKLARLAPKGNEYSKDPCFSGRVVGVSVRFLEATQQVGHFLKRQDCNGELKLEIGS